MDVVGYLKDYTITHLRMPRIGPVIIGTILKDLGYEVRIYSEGVRALDKKALDYICSADLVAISLLTVGANRAYALASLIREVNRDTILVMGDVQPTIMPEHCLAHSDYVVRGEGDEVMVELLAALNEEDGAPALKEITGLSYWQDGKILHNGPRTRPRSIGVMADLSLVEFFVQPNLVTTLTEGRATMSVIQASRGCPIACKFCLGSAILGREYRTKEIEAVIENLKHIRDFSLGHRPVVFFIDNHFFIDKKWTRALLRRIIEEELEFTFVAFGQYFVGHDVKMLQLLKQAGFERIFAGFESINPETLKSFNKKQSEAGMRECIAAIHEHGLNIHGSFILGGDTDTVETAEATIQFAIDTDIVAASFFSLTECPFETHDFIPITDVVPQHRLLSDNLDHYDSNLVSFYPLAMRPSQLQQSLVLAHDRFYSPKRAVKALLHGDYLRAYYRLVGHWAQRKMIVQMRDHIPYLQAREAGKYDAHDRLIESSLDYRRPAFENPYPSLYYGVYGLTPEEPVDYSGYQVPA